MDVNAAGSFNVTAAQGGGKSSSVLQALASVYSNAGRSASSLLPASDALSSLAGSGADSTLASALYAMSPGTGLSTLLGTAQADSSMFTAWFSNASDSTLEGFPDSGFSPQALMAMAAYANPPTTAETNPAGAPTVDPTTSAQLTVQAAQAAVFNNTLNLLA